MKVIFLQDVPNVARAGEMKEVADGYGRNYLIPRKLAAQADPKMTNAIEAQVRASARQVAQNEAQMTELANQLDGKEIVITARVGANERLYGSITTGDIIAELEKSHGVTVDKRKIELENPIRELGSHEVPIRLTKDIIPKVKLNIIEEEKAEGEDKKETKAKPKAKKKAKAKAPKVAAAAEAETQEETAAEETKTEEPEETE